jgi:hypothetical protein
MLVARAAQVPVLGYYHEVRARLSAEPSPEKREHFVQRLEEERRHLSAIDEDPRSSLLASMSVHDLGVTIAIVQDDVHASAVKSQFTRLQQTLQQQQDTYFQQRAQQLQLQNEQRLVELQQKLSQQAPSAGQQDQDQLLFILQDQMRQEQAALESKQRLELDKVAKLVSAPLPRIAVVVDKHRKSVAIDQDALSSLQSPFSPSTPGAQPRSMLWRFTTSLSGTHMCLGGCVQVEKAPSSFLGFAHSVFPARRLLFAWTLSRASRLMGMVYTYTDLDKMPKLLKEVLRDLKRLMIDADNTSSSNDRNSSLSGGNATPALDGLMPPPPLIINGAGARHPLSPTWLVRLIAIAIFAIETCTVTSNVPLDNTSSSSSSPSRPSVASEDEEKRISIKRSYAIVSFLMQTALIAQRAREIIEGKMLPTHSSSSVSAVVQQQQQQQQQQTHVLQSKTQSSVIVIDDDQNAPTPIIGLSEDEAAMEEDESTEDSIALEGTPPLSTDFGSYQQNEPKTLSLPQMIALSGMLAPLSVAMEYIALRPEITKGPIAAGSSRFTSMLGTVASEEVKQRSSGISNATLRSSRQRRTSSGLVTAMSSFGDSILSVEDVLTSGHLPSSTLSSSSTLSNEHHPVLPLHHHLPASMGGLGGASVPWEKVPDLAFLQAYSRQRFFETIASLYNLLDRYGFPLLTAPTALSSPPWRLPEERQLRGFLPLVRDDKGSPVIGSRYLPPCSPSNSATGLITSSTLTLSPGEDEVGELHADEMEAIEGLLLPGYLPFPSSMEPRVVDVVNMQLNIRIAKFRHAASTIAGGSSCALHFEAVEGCAKMQLFSQTPELRAQLRSQRLAAQQERTLYLARLEAQRQNELQAQAQTQAQAERALKQQQEAIAIARRQSNQQQHQQQQISKPGSGILTWHALDSNGNSSSSISQQHSSGGIIKSSPWGGESLKLRPNNNTTSISAGNLTSNGGGGVNTSSTSSSASVYDSFIYSMGIGLAQQQQQQHLFGSNPPFEAPIQQPIGGWGSPLRTISSSPQHLREQRTSSSPEPLSSLHMHPSHHQGSSGSSSMSLGLSATFASKTSSGSSPTSSPGLHSSVSPPPPGPVPGGGIGASSTSTSTSGQAFKLAAKGFTGLSLTKGKGFPVLPPNQ